MAAVPIYVGNDFLAVDARVMVYFRAEWGPIVRSLVAVACQLEWEKN